MKKITQQSNLKTWRLKTKALLLTLMGSVLSIAEAQTFSYTGNVQTVTLPAGAYDIQMWGAKGGGSQGGASGYSRGTFNYSGGTLYIVVGGAGGTGGNSADLNGGYNGGGARSTPGGATRGSGGGATHVSTSSGLLTDTLVRTNIVMVAGGGGGGSNKGSGVGGGGGLIGANSHSSGTAPGEGGTQTAGGAAGTGTSGSPGTAGQGGASLNMAGAGGGGWYGGGAGGGSIGGNTSNGGGGGSGYINNPNLTNVVTIESTQAGFIANPDTSGNGRVVITNVLLSTSEASKGNDINIYPNPTKDFLYVTKISDKAIYKIYGIEGKLLTSGSLSEKKIDVRNLINGVYIIDLEDSKVKVQKKFIKN